METIHDQLEESVVIDGNCYYTEHNKFLKIPNHNYLNLEEWIAADPVRNTHSVEADPFYNEQMQGLSPWLQNRGFGSNRVTVDYWGNERDLFNDIGAYERSIGAVFPFPERSDNILTVGSGKEYESLQDCFDALNYNGIRRFSPTNDTHLDTLFIRLDAGTYAGHYFLNHIAREEKDFESENDAFVVFEPANPNAEVTLTFPTEEDNQDPILKINGADKFILRNIRFQNNSLMYGNFVQFIARSEQVKIENCTFDAIDPASSVHALNFDQTVCEDVTIQNNNFIEGDIGIFFNGENYNSNRHKEIKILENNFSGTEVPIDVSDLNNADIKKNTMDSFHQAIACHYSGGSINIMSNRMESGGFSGSYTAATLLYMTHLESENEDEGLTFVNNNTISVRFS
jgi:hypothetical protein